MGVAVVIILVVLGTVVFHFMSPWWWTPIASNWGFVDDTIIITFWVTGVVFIAVGLFLAYCLFRFRAREGRTAEYEPENHKLETWLTVGTAVGVAAMLAPGLFVWHQFVTVPDDAYEIEVVGQQWGWAYRFPGADGKLGASDVRKITDDNPFGLIETDPAGQDDVLVDDVDLHMPIDKPVKVLLRSIDVLHNFYVPQFRAKMDMVPGSVTFFWLTPTRTGTFDILCFELCGVGHYAMRGQVTVESEENFQAWLGEYQTFSESLADARRDKDDGSGSEPKLAARDGATESAPSGPAR